MEGRNYYQEFSTSIIGRIRARWAYVRLNVGYKLMAEVNGIIMVGANYRAREIAVKVFNEHLGDMSKEERMELLEKIYVGKRGSVPHAISSANGKKNILEMLCQDVIFDMIKRDTLKETIARLRNPSQSASSGH